MTHTLTLKQDDHITFQLYEASTDPFKIKKRRKSYLIMLTMGFFFILFSYLNGDNFLFYYAISCTFLFAILGNSYLRWRHKKHYVSHVKNIRKGIFDERVQIEIGEGVIKMADKTGDSHLKISEISLVNEITEFYFLKISTGPTFILPKRNIALNEEVNTMIKNYNIPHTINLDWKWK
ncbi:hypothetical protein [Pedobacter foliorum]|uniref:hypothetical protein n=1 Tax=Pedobacter foliorum TaxID=2739058 RepID=UPI0015675979|nr:hypothetical protein [Pedobacter foliorum]NRF37224.1 hypothetical protein [Pedobacter foliorum]